MLFMLFKNVLTDQKNIKRPAVANNIDANFSKSILSESDSEIGEILVEIVGALKNKTAAEIR